MPKYVYELAGSEPVLQSLQEDLVSEEFLHVWEGEGPEENGTWGVRFFDVQMTQGVHDEEAAIAIGEELVALLNGALSVLAPNVRFMSDGSDFSPDRLFDAKGNLPPVRRTYILKRQPPLTLSKIYKNDGALDHRGWRSHTLAEDHFKHLRRVNGRRSVRVGKSKLLGLIDLGLNGERDYALLRYSGQPMDWVVIYKLRDTLTMANARTLTNEQRKKIGNTANNFSISGVEARHGVLDNPGSEADRITLETGAEWILKAVQRYMVPRLPNVNQA